MHFRVYCISVALLSAATGNPLASPQPEDNPGSLDLWQSDGDSLTEAPLNDDSLTLPSLNSIFSDAPSDYSLFSDGDAISAAFQTGSDGEATDSLVASCLGVSNVDSSSDLDILISRDSLTDTWTSLRPATEENQCIDPLNRNRQPSPQPELRIPSLEDDFDSVECPPLPDGRKRQPLCCYKEDIEVSPGVHVAQGCWNLNIVEFASWGCNQPGNEAHQRCCLLYFIETSEGFTCTEGFEKDYQHFNPSK